MNDLTNITVQLTTSFSEGNGVREYATAKIGDHTLFEKQFSGLSMAKYDLFSSKEEQEAGKLAIETAIQEGHHFPKVKPKFVGRWEGLLIASGDLMKTKEIQVQIK